MSFRPTEHPVLKLPSAADMAGMDLAQLEKFLRERERLIELEKEDAIRYGYSPWTFRVADAELESHSEILAMGQNRSGKTVWAARRVVRGLIGKPNAVWACFHSSEASSINQQQPVIHAHLPPEWRDVGRQGQVAYVKYTKQNGFSGGKFTLPNGSQCFFFNYKQDVTVFEGYELDGYWFDELVPLAFIEAMEFRLGRERRTEGITTFTPVTGYTPTVGRFLAGATVRRTHAAELLGADRVHARGCPPGHLPLVMQCRRPEACVVWFPWGSNPYGANEEVRRQLVGASEAKIKIRAYGWTDKQVNGAFAKYGNAHRMTRARFREVEAKGGTRYVSCDPGGTKNWFVKWYLVTPGEHVIVYREWPDFRTHGEWAISPGGQDRTRLYDWRPGPAQRSEAGKGIRAYKELILKAEGWVWDEEKKAWDGSKAERIEARFMDPRMGGMEAPGEDEGTSIIALMADESVDAEGHVLAPAMEWIPAPGSRVEETVQMVVERMDYDEEAPVDVMNCPKWYVVAEDCQQTDLAYQEFTGQGTEKDALKDVIDPDRYFVKADAGYVEDGRLVSRQGRGW